MSGSTPSRAPIIGIAPDLSEPKPGRLRLDVALAYAECVRRAGGLPMVLPPVVELIPAQVELCAGFVLTGGDDPAMEPFGRVTHPKAARMHPARQAYDTALAAELLARRTSPTLGVCLGMQMLALASGGDLDQHLPDGLSTHAQHRVESGGAMHRVRVDDPRRRIQPSDQPVASHHHQAVRDPGRLRVIAKSPDGVIEGIADDDAPFIVGVQWHPERTEGGDLGQSVFDQLLRACALDSR